MSIREDSSSTEHRTTSPSGPAFALTQVALPALAENARCEATLLFADLHGYTAFTEERDIEQVAAVVEAIKQEATRIVHAHGGIVNQFVGDEIMALFGFPQGKEDAPRRAIAAALELHAFVRSADLQEWLGPEQPLRLHSGIDAGVVLVRTRDVRNGLFELTGRAVNRAAGLRTLAEADELLVSQRVYARVAPFFRAEPRGEATVAGSDEKALGYRIISHRASAPPSPVLPSAPIARTELAELRRVWAERSSHTGGLVVVQGAAGSGKSRLLASFAAQLASEGVTTWSLTCRDDDGQPFSALSGLISGPVSARPTSAREGSPHELGTLSYRWQQAASSAGALLDPHAYTTFIERAADLVATHVENAGNLHAFMIDDVQRLDPSSRAVLLHLGDRLFPQGHMFVCAARDDDASREQLEHFRSALHGEQHAQIQLGPLNAEDASGLVAEYLGPRYLHAPDIFAQLSSLSDGTPLSLLELLELLLENQSISARDGAWQLDAESMRSMQLAASARVLVERRIGQLGPDRLSVLRAAAIMRGHIDVALLSRVTGLDLELVQTALDDAALARMLELDASGMPRFAHDTVWEVLLSGMSLDEQRALHQQVMQRMREREPRDAADTFALARHCAAGLLEQDPRASFDTLWSAARLARAACDDVLALALLRPAQQAARLGGIDPDASFFAELAEASLRVGELDSAFESFEAAAQRTPRGFERAHLFGRMAWIRHYHADGAPAIEMLKQALRECGQPFHSSSVAALGQTLARRVRTELGAGELARLGQRQREILCGLYGKLVRVCLESAQASLALVACLALADAARELPLCRALVQANALDAFAWNAVGAHARSRRIFDEALSNAEWLRDPEAIAYCHQLGHVLAAWQGDLAQSERHAASALEDGGQHLDLGEVCLIALSMYTIESVRGRVERALTWLEPAIERVRAAGHAPAMFMLVEQAACSGLISSDRQAEIVHLKSRLRFVKRAQVECRGVLGQISFQFRVQNLLERDDPGPPLEQLIADFERLELDPKSVPPLVSVFYLHVAHARVHQCLRASAAERPGCVEKLRRALVAVDASTRAPPQHAHASVLRAALAHFEGRAEQSEKWLCEAEKLARADNVPWVSYTAARLRAHALRARGKHEPALDQARVAAMYARQHGQLARLRFLREELGLDS